MVEKLLVLAPFPPRTDGRHGGARATAAVLRALAERHAVGLAYVAAPDGLGVDPAVRESAVFVEELPRPDVRGLRRWTRRAAVHAALLRGIPVAASELAGAGAARRLRELVGRWRPDVVQIEFLTTAVLLDALGSTDAPRLLVDHDASLRPVEAFTRLPRPAADRLQALDARAWRRFERAAAQRVDAAVVFTDRDLAASRRAGFRDVRLSPLVVPPRDRPLDPLGTAGKSVLFVGYYRHPPNADAARWLVGEIFPRVRAVHPESELVLVGGDVPADVAALARRENVVVAGAVEDVDGYLDRAAVVVAPLRSGGGTRVKVLEALGAGKALVATPRAVEGLDVPDGDAVVLASSSEAFAGAVAALLGDPGRRARLAGAAYAWARAALDPAATADRYARIHADLLRLQAR